MFVKISIHALLAESDALAQSVVTFLTGFLSTLSLRRATYPAASCRPRGGDFYPRSPCGERPAHWLRKSWESKFLSTLSLRRATVHTFYRIDGISIFLSTLSLRRATPQPGLYRATHGYFYPRSPCGERPVTATLGMAGFLFLSTLSLRRATHAGGTVYLDLCISIHALLAESDRTVKAAQNLVRISIHALLAESDWDSGNEMPLYYWQFLSTLSLRRATRDQWPGGAQAWQISIHALLAESDGGPVGEIDSTIHFYPRSPCGERHPLCS